MALEWNLSGEEEVDQAVTEVPDCHRSKKYCMNMELCQKDSKKQGLMEGDGPHKESKVD